MKVVKTPSPLFADLKNIKGRKLSSIIDQQRQQDYKYACKFLKSYNNSQGTFNSYRREIEKLLQWTWLIVGKTIKSLKRSDIEDFINFCQKPPEDWISIQKHQRFIEKYGETIPNPKWRPFTVSITKTARNKGTTPKIKNYKLSPGAIKETFAILSSFYNYLLQEEYVSANPVALIRQKSKFIRKQQGNPKIRRLSELQWQYVMQAALNMAADDPNMHERTLFIITALYAMYLRISELAASSRWVPTMNHFYRDNDGNWWFTTVGKGNKQRQIAVSNAMLIAFKRWRKHLKLSLLPSPADNSPLLPKIKGDGPISNISNIREIVQRCFDKASIMLEEDGFTEEKETLGEATVHWLRHTGISDDVKIRPREHVRDDAGHSSSSTTDKYIDIELRERHRSAKNKPIV
jgi:site-specific recombinase XerD